MTEVSTKNINPPQNGLRIARATAREVCDIHALGMAKISADIASLDTFQNIHVHNADALWAVYGEDDVMAGFFAFLMLTRDGTDQLVDGMLDTRAPSTQALAATGEPPHAIYIWALVAEKKVAGALPLVLGAFDAAVYARTDLYARPATEGGLRLMKKCGFRSVVTGGDLEFGALGVFRRSDAPAQIRYPGRSETAHAYV